MKSLCLPDGSTAVNLYCRDSQVKEQVMATPEFKQVTEGFQLETINVPQNCYNEKTKERLMRRAQVPDSAQPYAAQMMPFLGFVN